MTPPAVAVVGAGAMGLLLAAACTRAGVPAVLVARGPEAAQQLAGGVLVTRGEAATRVAVPIAARLEDVAPPEFWVLAVKSYDLGAVLPRVARALGPHTTVVTWQNGLDAPEEAAAALGPDRVLAAATEQAATRTGPGEVSHRAEGPTWVGPLSGGRDPRADRLVGYLQAAGFLAAASPAMAAVLWGKAAVNAAINPLSALLGWPNGRLAAEAPTRTLLRELADEVGAAAAAAGHPLHDPGARALAVAAATGRNVSSMLQDVRAGRPTELEAITGAVLRRAAALGVPMPANQVVYHLMAALTMPAPP